jgi:serine/threonine protein kinase
MQCPKCKQILDEGVRFCPNDGTPLTETGLTQSAPTPTGGRLPPKGEIALPAVVGNRYQLLELRGGGGMAKVYRATDMTLEREVAVKLINPDLRMEPEFDERFKREARIASQLSDPHIVVVHDFAIDSQLGPYLVMEYLHGQSLRERIAATGILPLKAGLQLAGQLLLALIHAHGKGIVHRDIKPDNIFLLNQSGVRLHTRVLDFGIARIYKRDDASQSPTITHAGAVMGTPRYMSPEQLAGEPVDHRTDLYSAALVIHEALTGQLPYIQGKKLCELCPDATPALQDLIDQCLKPNPAERPPTAVEVYLRLQELGKASGILLLPPGAMDRLVAARKASEPTVQYNPAGARRKRRILIGLGSVALVAVLAIAGWFLFGPSPDHKGPESLHGIHIGDTPDEAEKHVALVNVDMGNPWRLPGTQEHMGHVLKIEDMKLPPGEPVKVRRSVDNKICVLFHSDHVIAVVSSSPNARTARGIGIGSGATPLYNRYPEIPDVHVVTPGSGSPIEVRRYPTLGIGFEFQGSQITGIALFPAEKAVANN